MPGQTTPTSSPGSLTSRPCPGLSQHRFQPVAKLTGHIGPVMRLTVTQTASQHDLVVTGSKDHYVKVAETGRGRAFSGSPPHFPQGPGSACGREICGARVKSSP